MFTCIAIEEYKHKRRGGSIEPGAMATVYRVELDYLGRPIWILHEGKICRAWGYQRLAGDGANEFEVGRLVAKSKRRRGVPIINTAAHRKLVTKEEAVELLGSNWLPAAALDYLTENVDEEMRTAKEIKQ